MTVLKPMQSPTTTRARVATPWPTSKDTSKPLPEPPGKHGDQASVLPESAVKSTEQDTDVPSTRIPKSFRKKSSDRTDGSPNSMRKKQGHFRTEDQKHIKFTVVTPKSSSENERSLPSIPNQGYEASHSEAPLNLPQNNPFRRKEVPTTRFQEQEEIEKSSAIWASEEDSKNEIAIHGLYADEKTGHHHSSSQISNEAPQLDWQEQQSPIDLTGFSGGYFTELQELQQGIMNSPKVQSSDPEPHEVEAATKARKLSAEGVPTVNLDAPSPFESLSNGLQLPSPREPLNFDPLYTNHPLHPTMAPDSKNEPPSPISQLHRSNNSDQGSQLPLPNAPSNTNMAASNLNPESHSEPVQSPIKEQDRVSPRPRKSTETYQVRLVNWFDASSPNNPRRSPIMVQNANGPCPLLALVNALVLSTPWDLTTALVETLRVREQVTLGLLLDAVIDELMSGRRGSSAESLPDVSDLYAFLLNLHTGMNVNPRFVPVEEQLVSLIDAPIDTTSTLDRRQLGGFEYTREMRLYQTFDVPLIHGWIPPKTHSAFVALKRAAKTYEDAQNALFREEELEEKLKNEGLPSEEQLMLEDIASVKYFLSSTATQLTGYGLDSMTECLSPGSISILFRNDHFSTLYKHPRSGQLLTLVTDMGYAGHDEVVWESLVDVSGEGSEFFAGDFRPVGNVVETTEHTSVDEEGWETVTRRPRRTTRTSSSRDTGQTQPSLDDQPSKIANATSQQSTKPKSTEQEDHDLALAMQLQEEEEDRLRQDNAARRREDELSERYLSNSDPATGRRTFPGFGRGARGGSSGAPTVPPRGGGPTGARSARHPPVNRRRSSNEEPPPPSYEQAAKGEPYHPPPNHPAHPTSTPSLRGMRHRTHTGSSAYAEQQAALATPPGSGRGSHTSGGSGRGGSLPSPGLTRPPSLGNSSNQNPALPRRPRGRISSWGPNSDVAPSVARRAATERPTVAEEDGKGGEGGKKEKDCIVM